MNEKGFQERAPGLEHFSKAFRMLAVFADKMEKEKDAAKLGTVQQDVYNDYKGAQNR